MDKYWQQYPEDDNYYGTWSSGYGNPVNEIIDLFRHFYPQKRNKWWWIGILRKWITFAVSSWKRFIWFDMPEININVRKVIKNWISNWGSTKSSFLLTRKISIPPEPFYSPLFSVDRIIPDSENSSTWCKLKESVCLRRSTRHSSNRVEIFLPHFVVLCIFLTIF